MLFRPHLSLSLGSFPLSFVFIYYHLVFVFSLDILDTEFWTSPTCDTREVALLTENMKFTALASRASRTYMLYKGFQQMEIICYYPSGYQSLPDISNLVPTLPDQVGRLWLRTPVSPRGVFNVTAVGLQPLPRTFTSKTL